MDIHLTNELKNLCNENPSNTVIKTKTLKDLSVEMIDHSSYPYVTMFEMALQTWGEPGKWKKASPELRFEVVKKILERKALPLALEAPYFAFQINNCSRAAFDQIARTRLAVYAARGFKDNYLNYTTMNIPSRLSKKKALVVKKLFEDIKKTYAYLQTANTPNWAARCVMPMYTTYNFMMVMPFSSLQGFCSSRMQTTEMEDTVGVAWLMREAVKKEFPLLANYLRPAGDWKHSDTTVDVNGFAEELGIIHGSDNRNPGFNKNKYEVRYNEPCTDIKKLQKELGIDIPSAICWKDYTWETLPLKDKTHFRYNTSTSATKSL